MYEKLLERFRKSRSEVEPGPIYDLFAREKPVLYRTDGIFEITVSATVQTKIQDRTVFLVEAKQAGIFEVRGIPGEQFDPVVGIVCPGIVYPYLRANVADLVNRTGLPPIHLTEINFEALYRQKLAQSASPQSPIIVPPGSNTRQ